MRFPPAVLPLCLALLPTSLPAAVPAGPADDPIARTVVLVNSRQPESVALGRFYLAQRGIPPANLVALPLPEAETVTWRRFVDEVWQPLQDELVRRGWIQGLAATTLDRFGRRRTSFLGHRIAYLVVCRGTPLRVEHDPLLVDAAPLPPAAERFNTNQCAVDSELSLLAAGPRDINGFIPNLLFQQGERRMVGAELVVRVARLDGPDAAAARSLVTSALTAERQGLIGRYYVDLMESGAPAPEGERWLTAARDAVAALDYEGDTDTGPGTFEAAARFDAPAIYLGWYAGRLNGPFLRKDFAFPPGAIALHIHSYSADTLRSPLAGWCGPFVARGVAATVGNVYEPYLQLTHRPDLLLQALVRGRTLGEAAYEALPYLSWQTVLLGDPHYRPFKAPLAAQVRRWTELPADLAPYVIIREARRLDRLGRPAEAAALRSAALRRAPSLPVALAQAAAAAVEGPSGRAAALVPFLPASDAIGMADWPLVRQAAQVLARVGAAGPALEAYRRLAPVEAPSPAARLALLNEARLAARTAGDAGAEQEFTRLRDQAALLQATPPLSP